MAYLTYNGKILMRGSKWIDYSDVGPTLPPYTIRLKFTEGTTPTFRNGTAVQVSTSPNVWDLTYENADWTTLCDGQSNLIEVISANTSGVTNMFYLFSNCTSLASVHMFDTSSVTDMHGMFHNCLPLTTVPLFNTSNVTSMGTMFAGCTSLTTVPLFDTSNVTNMNSMFFGCSSITTVPLFDTSSVTTTSQMFQNCTNVQSGALALYQQASTQAVPPANHAYTFSNCGSNTESGRSELAQIPQDWGGTAT